MNKNSGGHVTTRTPVAGPAAKRSRFVQEPAAPARLATRRWLAVVPVLAAVLLAVILIYTQQGAPGLLTAQAETAGRSVALPAAEAQGQIGGINSQAPNKRYPLVLADANGELRFPVSSLVDGKARFFSTNLPDGKQINFFLIRSSDGVVRAALDACDVCYSARKGYHQEGDVLVCNNCGQRFPSARINEVKGGCNPAPLTRAVQGETVVIKMSDLQKDNRAENGQPLF